MKADRVAGICHDGANIAPGQFPHADVHDPDAALASGDDPWPSTVGCTTSLTAAELLPR